MNIPRFYKKHTPTTTHILAVDHSLCSKFLQAHKIHLFFYSDFLVSFSLLFPNLSSKIKKNCLGKGSSNN